MGYAIGITPVVGYYYGAQNEDELRNLLKKSIVLVLISSLVLTGLAELSAEVLAKIFASYDKNLLSMTTTAIRIFSLSYIVSILCS